MGRKMTSNRRQYRPGGLARYMNPPVTEPIPRYEAELRPDHPALRDGRTVYETSVYDAADRDRILIHAINNAKIGGKVTKGPWAGFPIYTLALEERATCPRSCGLWAACYGNALPVTVRFRYNDGFLMSLEEELVTMGDKYPRGFAVRAHVLGDFVDLDYVKHWALWMKLVPSLHVWGYTAHPPGSEISDMVLSMNRVFAGRWAFRNSVAPGAEVGEWQVSTTWDKPERADAALHGAGGLICPAEMGATATCGTCALCWSPAAADTRIVFLGHGMKRPGRPRKTPIPIPTVRNTPPSERFTDVSAFLAAHGVTRLPTAKARGL